MPIAKQSQCRETRAKNDRRTFSFKAGIAGAWKGQVPLAKAGK